MVGGDGFEFVMLLVGDSGSTGWTGAGDGGGYLNSRT